MRHIVAGAAAFPAARLAWGASPHASSPAPDAAGPIADIGSLDAPGSFIGDQPASAHHILWGKAEYLASKGGLPQPTEEVPVVIVGGGIAGLSAAHRLRDLKPLVLEQSARFGGNAKGERWGDLVYGIGSAYVPRPDKGSALERLFDELGLSSKFRFESSRDEAMLVQSGRHHGPGRRAASAAEPRLYAPFWSGASDPARASEFKRVYEALLRIQEEDYPDIPARTPAARERLRALDKLSFSEWAARSLGHLHPHIDELFHEYCWDSMGGSCAELSAAQVLNFLTADLAGGSAALPGGNGAIAEALYQSLARALPRDRLRARALTCDITVEGQSVRVSYEDETGRLRAVRARACIVAAPKFIARVLVSNLPESQREAMHRLRYRAFLVANVLINGRVPSPHYGVFNLRGEVPKGDVASEDEKRAFTSLIFAGFASQDRPDRSSLTLYKAFPFDGGRSRLSPESAFAEMRSKFESELPATLAALHIDPSRVAGLRIARWGHALPLAARGLLADGTLEAASRPFAGRVFFGQQDNWANPCIESALAAGEAAAEDARHALRS